MSDLMNQVNKDNIRAGMNLLFSMMKFMATILNMASDSQLARDTICSTAEGILTQASELYRDIGTYVTELSKSE